MIDIFNFNQITPEQIIVVLVGLVLLTIIAVFILPVILRAEKLSFTISYSFKKIRKNLVWSVTVAVVVGVLLGGSIFYYFASLPTVITAAEFKKSEAEILKEIEGKSTFEVVQKGDIYIIDMRGNLDFVNGHLAGSVNIQGEDLENTRDIKSKILVLYSSADNYDQVYQAGRNFKLAKFDNLFTKVYVIEDGYEGVQDSGLTIYGGSTSEEEIK